MDGKITRRSPDIRLNIFRNKKDPCFYNEKGAFNTENVEMELFQRSELTQKWTANSTYFYDEKCTLDGRQILGFACILPESTRTKTESCLTHLSAYYLIKMVEITTICREIFPNWIKCDKLTHVRTRGHSKGKGTILKNKCRTETAWKDLPV